jgi:hypothetical protein
MAWKLSIDQLLVASSNAGVDDATHPADSQVQTLNLA